MSLDEFYAILKLRMEVFIVEQKSIYQDIDDLDQEADHLLGFDDGNLIAYLRVYSAEGKIHIGRIVIFKEWRGKGFAKDMMNKCLSELQSKESHEPIVMSAQTYLKNFYESLGFKIVGSPYDDGGVEHIDMELRLYGDKSRLDPI